MNARTDSLHFLSRRTVSGNGSLSVSGPCWYADDLL
ncbi:hypothetical protein HDIA_2302 [Hartmannibacter diazotrophicus]|uniref:Uncharacterized protein n=1 Tax=Hartmannibacter diazotrophicus TaxID=1482074 RepID=A0A2C9D6G7_9HYPH|nr:hypothetical protein HDIA_2302 [Hartmannibacter diazotrophicus]